MTLIIFCCKLCPLSAVTKNICICK
jgi:hypothetical protein